MRIDASKLEWHDAGVDGTNYEDGTRTMQWKIEVFRWDIGDRGDAQPGLLIFEGVQSIQSHHDLNDVNLFGQVDWEILTAQFMNTYDQLKCEFKIHLGNVRNPLGGHGYGEIVITCLKAWFIPEQKSPE